MLGVGRKWGRYWTLLNGAFFKVKILRFNRGGKLSVQKHSHRNELWLFLYGRGDMAVAGKLRDMEYGWVEAGDYIPVKSGEWHHYMSDGVTYVLEVQYGDRCDEADIERA